MRKFYPAFIAICLLLSALTTYSQSGTYGNNVLTERPNTPMSEMVNGFIEILPLSYASSPGVKYPVFIFLEGQSQFGNGGSELSLLYGLNEGMFPDIVRNNLFPNSYVVGGNTYEFIVIVPQIRRQVQTGRPSAEQMASPAEVNDIVNYVMQNYRVDEDRVYLSGLSLGGGSTWNYAGQSTTYGNRLAAIVPFSGASNLDDNLTRDDNIAAANLPVWTFANSEDVVYRDLAQEYIDAINAIPAHTADAYITIYTRPPGDHNSWTQPLQGGSINAPGGEPDNIFLWMLNQTRSLTAPVFATLSAGSDQTLNLANGNMVVGASSVTFSDGTITLTGTATPAPGRTIASTQWVRVDGNGGTITTPNALSTTVTGLKPGTYTFQLRATDDQGLITVDNQVVTVNAPPENRYRRVEAEAFTAVSAGPLVERSYIDEGPAYGVGFLSPGTWLEYSLPGLAAGSYSLYIRYVSPFGNPGVQIFNGTTTYNTTLTSNGSTWSTVRVDITMPADGTLRFTSQGSEWNFNSFELVRTSSILPVRFVYFNANCTGNGVSLQWKTSMEQDSKNYSIQRSTDGVNWSEIGNVLAAGQSTDGRTYTFVDRNSGNSRTLYRIVQFDIDGRSSMTGIVRGNCAGKGSTVSVYPNPSHGNSTLSLSLVQASKVSLSIIDGRGAVVRRTQLQLPAGNTSIPLNMQGYASGVYTIKVDFDNQSQTIQLAKN
jgi:dienelactone hydrolase